MPAPKQRKVAIVGSRSVGKALFPRLCFTFERLLRGASAAGKSSLAVQFVDGHFVDSYYPTIENTFSKTVRYKNQDFLTEIVDTAGQDEYSILNSKHFIGIHGYMLVYSVSSLPSLVSRPSRNKFHDRVVGLLIVSFIGNGVGAHRHSR
jgi:Ras homolog enriched in brain